MKELEPIRSFHDHRFHRTFANLLLQEIYILTPQDEHLAANDRYVVKHHLHCVFEVIGQWLEVYL